VALEGGREPRCWKQRGSGSATFMRRLPSYPGKNHCHCQRSPVWADGSSWRSGDPAAGLSRPGMPGDVLDLFALRSRTTLLQPGLPLGNTAPATPRCQPPPRAESGGPTRSSRSATCLSATSCVNSRDGSRFLSVISPAPFGCGEAITMPMAVPLRSTLPAQVEKRPDLCLCCSLLGRAHFRDRATWKARQCGHFRTSGYVFPAAEKHPAKRHHYV
jgi:hypothetical protein